uniref:Rab3GAP regulatory subunit C-terminal domain-containing protein n=1 Tax=Panagrolaimus davidi TaxID=227884 RepID=A0A914PIN8_9BILA
MPRIQHGLALMLWDTFLQQPFQRLYTFLNHHDGRFPHDRDARKDLLVAETDIFEFICCIERLLRCIVLAVVDLDQHPQIHLKYEDFIERFMDYVNLHRSTKVNRVTLAEMAGKHKSINYHLGIHHIHLIVSIKLQYLCSIQMTPKSLFDPIGHRAFFEPFHSHPLIPLARVETHIRNKRQTFLEECIQNVATNNAEASSQHLWQLVLELAEEWQLNVDSLRIKEIVMFYDNGMDLNAEQVSSAVSDRKQLAFELFPVVVNRIRYFLNEDPTLYGIIARKSVATITTLDYIKGFNDSPIPSFEVDPERTRRIIRFINNLLLQAGPSEVTAKLKILRDMEGLNDFIVNLRSMEK